MKRVAPAGVLAFHLAVEPAPASRPRVTRWNGVYYGKPYEKFRATAQPLADAYDGIPTDRPVVVLIECVMTKPKTGKLSLPKPDVDNLAKGPLDVMTKAKKFWQDDCQVVGLSVWKRYAAPAEEPGVYISWFETEEV